MRIVALVVLCTALITGCGDDAGERATGPDAASQSDVSASPTAEATLGSESEQEQSQLDEKDVAPSSSCVAVRKAILSDDKSRIRRAVRALEQDESASTAARQYADDYLNRDANDPQQQRMDLGLIQAACL